MDERKATKAMKLIIKKNKTFEWLTPPNPNGTITVVDVVKVKNVDEHQRIVEKWAKDVWDSWQVHHHRIVKLSEQLYQK